MPKHHQKSPCKSSSSSSSSPEKCRKSESRSRKHSGKKVCRAKVADLARHVTDNVYESIKCRMLRDKDLQLYGTDAYGSFYSTDTQTIPLGGNVIFQFGQAVHNIGFEPGATEIVVKRSGTYYVNLEMTVDQPAQFGIFVNGILDKTTTTATNSGAVQLNLHQILHFKRGDKVTFRNNLSGGLTGVITTSTAGGTVTPSNIIDMSFMRLGPLPKQLKQMFKKCDCRQSSCSPRRSHSKGSHSDKRSHSKGSDSD